MTSNKELCIILSYDDYLSFPWAALAGSDSIPSGEVGVRWFGIFPVIHC